MKLHFTKLMMGTLLTLGAAGCADKQAAVNVVTAKADALELTGTIISTAQAVSWTTAYQEAYPEDTWAAFTEAGIFNQLLDQEGCQGLRLYHATKADDTNTFVLVGVNSEGADMTNGLVADEMMKCPPHQYASILVAEPAEQILPPVLPAGAIIPLDKAVDLTKRYHATHAGNVRAGYFSAYVYRELLAQEGCIGIRIYKGLKEGNQECFVLVGVSNEGADMTDGLLYDLSKPCPPICSDSSPLMQ